jgi:hypothetical protein
MHRSWSGVFVDVAKTKVYVLYLPDKVIEWGFWIHEKSI